jgi:hypothetical protein
MRLEADMPAVAPEREQKVTEPDPQKLDRAVVERQIKILEALKAPQTVIKAAQSFLRD